jgi:hypothetical protein
MTVKNLASKDQGWDELLADDEDPLSTNKVTGWSVNVPIVGTCRPTTVCSDTCYFARGPSTWPAALRKQWRLLRSIEQSPTEMAIRIVRSAWRKKLDFLRWNGGGDLFPRLVECIDHATEQSPDLQHWIVSRKPELASKVTPRPNVWMHFSVDKASWGRLEDMRRMAPPSLQWHWSYQCDKNESPPSEAKDALVIFRDSYLLTSAMQTNDCPLNGAEDITGMCKTCRRCFGGEAYRQEKLVKSDV